MGAGDTVPEEVAEAVVELLTAADVDGNADGLAAALPDADGKTDSDEVAEGLPVWVEEEAAMLLPETDVVGDAEGLAAALPDKDGVTDSDELAMPLTVALLLADVDAAAVRVAVIDPEPESEAAAEALADWLAVTLSEGVLVAWLTSCARHSRSPSPRARPTARPSR